MLKPTILILHGWGLRASLYNKVKALLKEEGFSVYSIDLPGFGSEPLRKKVMNLDDYARFVKSYVEKKKIKKTILVGHSFGGRVSIRFAKTYPRSTYALILTGVPAIKQRLSLFRRTVQYIAISMGEIFRVKALLPLKNVLRKALYSMLGEWDYYNAGDLRQTFKKIIAEDLTSYLTKIKVPILLVWGKEDRVVPLSVGEKMKRMLPKAKLVVVKGEGHKLPYEEPEKFADIIYTFLKKL